MSEFKRIKLADLKPYEKNPYSHKENVGQIKKSIEDFGYNTLIEVDTNNEIITGHGRYEALRALGVEEVMVHVLTLHGEEKAAYRVASNETQRNSQINPVLMQAVIAEIPSYYLGDYGLAITEYTGESERQGEELDKENGDKPVFSISKDEYENRDARKVILFFEGEKYEVFLTMCKALMEQKQIDNMSDLVWEMLHAGYTGK